MYNCETGCALRSMVCRIHEFVKCLVVGGSFRQVLLERRVIGRTFSREEVMLEIKLSLIWETEVFGVIYR